MILYHKLTMSIPAGYIGVKPRARPVLICKHVVMRTGSMTSQIEPFVPVERQATEIDYLILSDHAEVVNGKMYLMGGGWSRFQPPGYPAVMKYGIALALRVPYLDAERSHHLTVRIVDADGADVVKVEADVETGRPPGMQGEDQFVPFAISGSTELQGPREFVVEATVDGNRPKRVPLKAMGR